MKNRIKRFELYYFWILFGCAALLGCTKNKDKVKVESLIGEWNWSYTRGNEKGDAHDVNPNTLNMSVAYIFNKDSVRILVNGAENESFPFHFSGDTLNYGEEKVFFRVSDTKDSLIFRNALCCEDIFEKAFIRK